MAGASDSKIRLLGRWASQAMLAYVRETLLAESGVVVSKEAEEKIEDGPSAASSASNVGRSWRKWRSVALGRIVCYVG